MEQELTQRRRPPAVLVEQNVDRREQLMRMGDIACRELPEMLGLERVEHAHVAHRQGNCGLGGGVEQAGALPARRRVALVDRPAEPHGRAGDQQRMQARRVAGPLVEQVLQAAADLDGENVHIGIGAGSAEPEPQPVREGPHAGGAGNFQGRGVVFHRRPRPGLEPHAAAARIRVFEAGRRLRPGPDPFAHESVHRLKMRHFSSIPIVVHCKLLP
ncbi:hypothetical protein [Acidiphilium sp.]|uniref:hypothetical protein n=1 Tax=Acidiphilium sp. TaxID=527 RepID=UPI00258C9D7B|nr:hypothetical protein [Acidiphilium sp.]